MKIIQIGKNKDQYVEEGCKEFLKRLSPFAKVEIVTLKEITSKNTFTEDRSKEEEGLQILKAIKEDDFLAILDERGQETSSLEFSKLIEKFKDSGQTLCFVIGGPYGLSDTVKKRANLLISLSKMTFTHQMIRIFLLEQIYRGLSIIQGKGYHNE